MAALCNRAGYIFSSCRLFFFSFFPPPQSQLSQIGYLPYFDTWCGPSANLECSSLEMQDPKSRHLGTIAQLSWAISSQLRHVSTIGKKLLSSNISSTCPHNVVNFGTLAAEIGPVVYGTLANFNGFRILAALCTAL